MADQHPEKQRGKEAFGLLAQRLSDHRAPPLFLHIRQERKNLAQEVAPGRGRKSGGRWGQTDGQGLADDRERRRTEQADPIEDDVSGRERLCNRQGVGRQNRPLDIHGNARQLQGGLDREISSVYCNVEGVGQQPDHPASGQAGVSPRSEMGGGGVVIEDRAGRGGQIDRADKEPGLRRRAGLSLR